MPVVLISRGTMSGGQMIGQCLSDHLGFRYVTREVLTAAVNAHGDLASRVVASLERASRADNIIELVREQVEMIPATRARMVEDAQRAALIFKHAGRDLRGVATSLYERVLETAEENVPEVKVVKRKAKRPARKAPARARKTAAAA